MSKIDDGGPAFARAGAEHYLGGNYEQDGMSLRDWFAGTISIAGLEFPDIDTPAKLLGVAPPAEDDVAGLLDFGLKVEAFLRFKKADAMIKARKGDAS